MKKAGKFIGRIFIGIVILALIAGAGGVFYFKSYLPNTVAPKSFPQIDGEIAVSGLDGRVDIYRDQMGIPHVYASTPHRVVNPVGRERYSIAFFLDPNPDAVIECLPTCVSAERPARYAPTTGAAYLKSRLDATYLHREKA